MSSHCTKEPTRARDIWVKVFTDLVGQKGRRGNRWVVARRYDLRCENLSMAFLDFCETHLRILGELIAQMVIDDQAFCLRRVYNGRRLNAAMIDHDDVFGFSSLHSLPF